MFWYVPDSFPECVPEGVSLGPGFLVPSVRSVRTRNVKSEPGRFDTKDAVLGSPSCDLQAVLLYDCCKLFWAPRLFGVYPDRYVTLWLIVSSEGWDDEGVVA